MIVPKPSTQTPDRYPAVKIAFSGLAKGTIRETTYLDIRLNAPKALLWVSKSCRNAVIAFTSILAISTRRRISFEPPHTPPLQSRRIYVPGELPNRKCSALNIRQRAVRHPFVLISLCERQDGLHRQVGMAEPGEARRFAFVGIFHHIE